MKKILVLEGGFNEEHEISLNTIIIKIEIDDDFGQLWTHIAPCESLFLNNAPLFLLDFQGVAFWKF